MKTIQFNELTKIINNIKKEADKLTCKTCKKTELIFDVTSKKQENGNYKASIEFEIICAAYENLLCSYCLKDPNLGDKGIFNKYSQCDHPRIMCTTCLNAQEFIIESISEFKGKDICGDCFEEEKGLKVL